MTEDDHGRAAPVTHTQSTYEQIAETYARANADRRKLTAMRAAWARELAGRPSGLLLDVGCGPGFDLPALAALGTAVVGFDLSAAMLRAGCETHGRLVVQADMGRLPLAAGCAAAVWCSAALLHLPYEIAPTAVAEMARVLRPGGVAAVSVKEGEGERWTESAYGRPHGRFFAFYTADQLDHLLTAGDLHVVHRHRESSRDGKRPWLVRIVRKQSI